MKKLNPEPVMGSWLNKFCKLTTILDFQTAILVPSYLKSLFTSICLVVFANP